MKNSRLLLMAFLLPVISSAQTAPGESKPDHATLIVQGLGDESILLPHQYPVLLQTKEMKRDKKSMYGGNRHCRSVPFVLNGLPGYFTGTAYELLCFVQALKLISNALTVWQ